MVAWLYKRTGLTKASNLFAHVMNEVSANSRQVCMYIAVWLYRDLID